MFTVTDSGIAAAFLRQVTALSLSQSLDFRLASGLHFHSLPFFQKPNPRNSLLLGGTICVLVGLTFRKSFLSIQLVTDFMTLSADFSQSTYDWDNMLDSYNSSYNEVQANAVARLMSDAGISIDMEYNSGESYAYYSHAIEALMAYFDYSTSMSYLLKNGYSGDWDEMLRGELDANRPIFYFGQTPTNAGHAFVLDGYDDNGYFHVNWGWYGWCDNYFLTSLLRPYVGNNNPDEANYSYDQGAIVGIQPDATGSGAIVLKSGITPAAPTMPANDVRASFDVQSL